MRPSALWTKDFLLGTVLNFFLLINYYVLMVMTAGYAMDLYGASASLGGLSASVFILGALITRIFGGAMIDRIGRRRLLMTGLLIEVVCSCLYLIISGFIPLFMLRLFHGFSFGLASTAVNTVIVSVLPDDRKGEGIGYFMLSSTLGAAIGPSLGLAISQSGGYGAIFVFATMTAMIGLLCAFMLKVQAPAVDTQTSRKKTLPRSLGGYIEVSILPICLVACMIFFAYSSMLTFLESFSIQTGLQQAATFFFVVYAAAMFITRPLTGKMFDRKGHRVVMVPAFVLFMLGMVLLGTATNGAILLVSAAFLGFGVGTIQSCGLTIAVQAAPDEHLALANSTFYIALDAGVGVGPMLLGLLVPIIGLRWLYISMAVVALIAMGIYLRFTRRRKA